MLKLALLASLVVGIGSGCAVRSRGVIYADPAPSLVYVSPGVSVIADYDQPIFYADNAYWRYDAGLWYRSGSYRGGWVSSRNVPMSVRRIDRPASYIRYNASVGRRSGPTVRDHRGQPQRQIQPQRRGR